MESVRLLISLESMDSPVRFGTLAKEGRCQSVPVAKDQRSPSEIDARMDVDGVSLQTRGSLYKWRSAAYHFSSQYLQRVLSHRKRTVSQASM